MTDISGGLQAGLSKLVGIDSNNKKHGKYAHLLDVENFESIKNGSDAADIDVEESIEIIYTIKEKLDAGVSNPGEKAYLKEVLEALLPNSLGLKEENINAFWEDTKGLDKKSDFEEN